MEHREAPNPAPDPTQEGFWRKWYLTQALKCSKWSRDCRAEKGTESGFWLGGGENQLWMPVTKWEHTGSRSGGETALQV